jgi:two-component system, OmpR family, sensor histidine kinase KdpD
MDERTLRVYLFHQPSKKTQYTLSVLVIGAVIGLGILLHDWIGYQVVALMLLLAVSTLAIFLDIIPVIIAALLSAVLWDFLFIPPRFTFAVGSAEDRLLLLMYFVIALINAVLTYKIKQVQKEVRRKEAKANAVNFYNALFNSLSHELRTPITTIIGATDNLITLQEKLLAEDKLTLINQIFIAGVRLNQQVENLLSMSRLESGFLQVKRDWSDIREIVYKTVHVLESVLTKYKVAIFIPEPFPLFKIDFGLMEHVLYNLISNAAIHTPEDSTITIEAECENDTLVIRVADNGPGFPPGEIHKVFDKFYRLQHTRPGGTGLGLSIARGFVEAHGGTLNLENLPVCGAKFTIRVPAETSYLSALKNE